MLTPADFAKVHPWSSVLQSNESETIARNIMVIKNRLGNEWSNLTWEEYQQIRQQDGNFSISEKQYFEEVIGYCLSEESARMFSAKWNDL